MVTFKYSVEPTRSHQSELNLLTMRLYLRTSVRESAKNAGLGIHHLTDRNLDEYLHREIKKSGKYKNTKKKRKTLLKKQALFIICLHSGNLLKGISPFIHHKYTKIPYFLLKRLTHAFLFKEGLSYQKPITRTGASNSYTRPMSRRFYGPIYF